MERRTGQDYADVMEEERERLQAIFAANFLQPSHAEIDEYKDKTAGYLQNENVAMIIPVRENNPVCNFLDYVTPMLPPKNITAVDGGSHPRALEAVRRNNGRILSASTVLDVLDWDRLLPIMATERKPYNEDRAEGKGLSVLAGYLFQYAMATYRQVWPRWICQHDSELATYGEYRGLEYLLYGLFQRPLASYIKMAQVGRQNERCLSARASYGNWATLVYVPPGIQKHANDVFEKLMGDEWMLAGEFMLSWDVAMNRPFATSFLEETLTALFADPAVCVYNPNPRSDGENPEEKESKMQQEINVFMDAVVWGEQHVDEWGIDDIARFNEDVLSRPLRMGWADPREGGPITAAVFAQNRIIPSIRMLADEGFINETRLKELISPA